MAVMVDLTIAGRTYQVACREGEEDNLRAAARLVDGKSREALAGLGTLSEARQFLFASLLLADVLVDDKPEAAAAAEPRATSEQPPPSKPKRPDPALILRAEALADRLESLAMTLENEGANL
jgi:cell division protein ZapA